MESFYSGITNFHTLFQRIRGKECLPFSNFNFLVERSVLLEIVCVHSLIGIRKKRKKEKKEEQTFPEDGVKILGLCLLYCSFFFFFFFLSISAVVCLNSIYISLSLTTDPGSGCRALLPGVELSDRTSLSRSSWSWGALLVFYCCEQR